MKYLTLFFLLFTSLIGIGQSEEYEFIGTIQLQDMSLISYKIVFQEEDGKITGKSISDFAGAHRTESLIEGTLDRKNDIISFNEVGNISTKSDYPDSTFCYVHLYDAKIKLKKRKRVIQGHFYSRYLDGSLCIEGDIYLMGEEMMFNKFEKVTKRAKILVDDKKLERVENDLADTKENLKNVLMADDDQMVFNVSTPTLQLKIWDAEHVDGDRISVYQNDKLILDNYSVLKEPKLLVVRMDSDIQNVRIVANNEGRIPPNSANIEIIEANNHTPLKVKLNKGNEVRLVFRKS